MLSSNVTAGPLIDATLAYILLQYRASLGDKDITEITIFRDYRTNPSFQTDAQLLFRVEDVPKDVLRSDNMDVGCVAGNVNKEVGQGRKLREAIG